MMLQQGSKEERLESTVSKFYGHHPELMDRFGLSMSKLGADLFSWPSLHTAFI